MLRFMTMRSLLQIVGCSVLLCATARSQAPARFTFEPGDWLVYERRETVTRLSTGERAGPLTTDQIQLWVLERNADNSLILLDQIRFIDDKAQPARGILANVDSRGVLTIPAEFREHVSEVTEVVELLPILRPASEVGAGWTSEPDVFGERYACTERGPDAGENGATRIEFVRMDEPPIRDVPIEALRGSFWMDAAAGRLTRRESTAESKADDIQRKVTITLRHAVRNELRWTQQRINESGRFTLAVRQQDAMYADVLADRTELAVARPRVQRLWEGCVADIPRDAKSPFRVLAGAAREWVERDAEKWSRRSDFAHRVIGKKSPPWSLQSAGGGVVRGSDLQDKWRVEAYWRFGPRESHRAMLDLEGLLPSCQNRWDEPPLRVIAMNLDANGVYARGYAGALTNISAHVIAEPLAQLEAMPEAPLIQLVDRDGVVKGVWFGWNHWRSAEILSAIP